MTARCCVTECNNWKKDNQVIRFHKFPKKAPQQCKAWALAAGRPDLADRNPEYLYNNCRICSKHFLPTNYKNHTQTILLPGVVPTVFENVNVAAKRPHTEDSAAENESDAIFEDDNVANKRPHTEHSAAENESGAIFEDDNVAAKRPSPLKPTTSPFMCTPRKVQAWVPVTPKTKKIQRMRVMSCRLRKQLKFGKNKPRVIQDQVQIYLKKNLPPAVYALVNTQLRVGMQSPNRRRWLPEDKTFALNIMFRSPAAYRLLRRFLSLPSKKTLTQFIGDLVDGTGLSPRLQAHLTEKVRHLADDDKMCVLSFDEIGLRKGFQYNEHTDRVEGVQDMGEQGRTPQPANYACVIHLQGLRQNWKQPVKYYLSSSPTPPPKLLVMIKQAIRDIQSIGLDVCATVCDQGGTNIGVYNLLGVTADRPYFTIDGKEIVAIYDCPHLLKSVRNNFRKYGVTLNDGKATWAPITAIYNLDKDNNVRIAPKLQAKHLAPVRQSSMKVAVAAQVMSRSVAAAIQFAVATGYLPADACVTSNFIMKMDQLFDSVNSCGPFDRSGKPFSGGASVTSGHIEYWEETIQWISTWKFQNSAGKNVRVVCQCGWIHSLRGIQRLVRRLHECGQIYLATRQVSQDALENIFSLIRGRGGHRFCPDVTQFHAAFKQVVVQKLLQATTGANCECDTASLLMSITANMSSKPACPEKSTSENLSTTETISQNAMVSFQRNVNLTSTDVVHPELPKVDLIQGSVIYYIAGYIAKKVMVKEIANCNECKRQLCTDELLTCPYSLLTYFKLFDDDLPNGLHAPSAGLFSTITEWTSIADTKFPQLIHVMGVKSRLVELFKAVSFTWFTHSEHLAIVHERLLDIYGQFCIRSRIKFLNHAFAEEEAKKSDLRKLAVLKHM